MRVCCWQVHDELIFEVRPSDVLRVAEVVRECMEGAVALRVPLQVKLSVGPSWGELEPLLSRSQQVQPRR